MSRLVRGAAALAACVGLAGCAFVTLKSEVEDIKRTAYVSGTVQGAQPGEAPIYVLHFVALERRGVQQLVARFPEFGFLVKVGEPNDLVAFQDLNGDQRFTPGEPAGVLARLGGAKPNARSATSLAPIALAPAQRLEGAEPEARVQAPRVMTTLGEIVTLADPRFDAERVDEGMWAPLTAAGKGGYGIHFFEAFDPTRVPVLFVHGIKGSPRDFEALVGNLDRSRYQPWVVYYPSGIRLPVLAKILAGLVDRAHEALRFERLVVVAHSMGGLVARGALLQLAAEGKSGFVRPFISLSTPWGGHAAAAAGVEYAPQAVPSWIDLAPGSAYLGQVATPLPAQLPCFLFFGVGGRGSRMEENNDGVVAVASELAPWAQDQAVQTFGFDLGHMGILRSPDVEAKLWPLLER